MAAADHTRMQPPTKHVGSHTVKGFPHTLAIRYCDNHVLAIDKPAGLLSQGDATGDSSVADLAKAWIKQTFNKPGNVYLGLVHRLDRPVSGLMVLGRTSKGASRLSEQFRTRSIEKTYVALVTGRVESAGELTDTLDGKPCRLLYRPISSTSGLTLLSVRPVTGRKHQIRRQLANFGHVIQGDVRYGASQPMRNRRIALHAYRLRILHPTTKEPLEITTERPSFLPSDTFPLLD